MKFPIRRWFERMLAAVFRWLRRRGYVTERDSSAQSPQARGSGAEPDVQTSSWHARAQPASEVAEAVEALEFVDAGFSIGAHASATGSREYRLFVPAGDRNERRPLLVMLHGCSQDPEDFALGTGMNLLAQEHGLIVLYPTQPPRHNAAKCWNWFQPGDQQRDHGEPAILAEMTRSIMADLPVDPLRVYVAGLSAGGAMAAILGREYPDLFAAVGVHSGLAPGAASSVATAFAAMRSGRNGLAHALRPPEQRSLMLPAIVFHGDRDTTVHPDNGEHVLAFHAQTGTCREEHGAAGRAYRRRLFSAPDGQISAEHWRIQDAGHAWSGGNPEATYTDPLGPDASREMLRFFLQRSRSARL